MLRVLIAVAIACASCVAIARRPIAVLDVLSPAVGANSTLFVLYDDGLVIYASGERDSLHPYFSAKLTHKGLANLSPPATLLSLKSEYITFQASDVPGYRLLIRVGQHSAEVGILGFLRQSKWHPDELIALPTALDAYLGRIVEYSNPRATPWQPEHIQMEIAPNDSAPPNFNWPANWPNTKSSAAVKLGPPLDGWYCMNLPGTDWSTLHQIRSRMKRDDTIAIDGKGWSIVSVRFVLPQEKKWDPIGACHPDL